MSPEVVMAGGYALALVLAAFILEWLSAHTHRRSLRYRTAGFTYDAGHDNWQCPEGEALWPHEYDREKRLVRYRAKATVCNACPIKAKCTDSDRGREVVRPIDPWPYSEAGRFHRGLSVMLVGLGLMIVVVEVMRNHAPNEIAALAGVAIVGLASGYWLARDLRRHPANFPVPTGSHGLGLPATAGDGIRADSRWASQQAEK